MIAAFLDPSTRHKWTHPLLKLILLLIILPAILTYAHIRYNISRLGYCFVQTTGPSLSSGIYSTSKDGRKTPKGVLKRIHSSSTSSFMQKMQWFGMPSAHIVDYDLTVPISKIYSPERLEEDFELKYDGDNHVWCLHLQTMTLACSPKVSYPKSEVGKAKVLYPPSDTWKYLDGDPGISLTVSCPANTQAEPKKKKSRKERKRNKNLDQILNRPATTLLLATNIYLAFRYWNDRVSPGSVSKIYSRMVPSPPHELWRAFSGAFAHFELLHIGFNMMNLFSIGEALEEHYGSIPFLILNLGLVVCTSAVMMSVFYIRIKRGNEGLAESSTVGYSGVLFAWMVILAIEMNTTCPVPMMPDLCFDTYTFGPFKFNLSPLVQLLVAQFIMPRVSFVGHLAGIVCGFLLHWGLLPLSLLAPQVLIPLVLMGHCYFVQSIIPMSRLATREEDGFEMVASLDPETLPPSSEPSPKELQKRRIEKVLGNYCKYMILATIASFFLFDFTIVSSQCISSTLFYFAVQAYTHLSADVGNAITGTLLRGYVISSILIIVTNSMTLASWIPTRIFIQAQRTCLTPFFPSFLSLLILTFVNMFGLILSCKVMSDVGEMKTGAIMKFFGYALNNARMVGEVLLGPTFIAFDGRGRSLRSGRPQQQPQQQPGAETEMLIVEQRDL